ncbi:hypothetical protein DES53_101944 [Roseimicrobium gellanilyticum]|uniref:Uncharacterized protein n=1 Tax=Roseimicrobium gellanilyticum TaxID=748857 RepID=A0A366HX51_9BACT|nr:hypothetical protein [Roseimicrobium gellanilyticum]RBP48144.1 hypothetical protein DES53_101944 [Roseimicrobium gellanilyticum]
MKTSILTLSAMLALPGLGFAEAVYDAAVERQLIDANKSLTNIDTLLDSINTAIGQQKDETKGLLEDIKEEAKKTTERLDDLLERIGNPADVDIGDRTDELIEHVNNARDKGLEFPRPPVEDPDDEFFNDDGDGMIKSIGTEYEYQPPGGGDKRTEQRDRTRYIGEAEQLKAIRQYYEVRDAAVERRAALLDILADVLDDMKDNTDDFANLAKKTALVEVIQGQLQVCSDDINNAFNDTAVKGLQVYAYSQVRSKGDAEPALLEAEEQKDKLDEIMTGISGGGPAIPAQPSGAAPALEGFLPWPVRR